MLYDHAVVVADAQILPVFSAPYAGDDQELIRQYIAETSLDPREDAAIDARATRLIALTDTIEHPGREDARAAGFERYLVKPVTLAELQKVLRRSVSIGNGKGGTMHGDARIDIYRGLP